MQKQGHRNQAQRRPCKVIKPPSQIMKMKCNGGSLLTRPIVTALLTKDREMIASNRAHQQRVDSVSRNLERDFIEIAGQRVYNSPYANVLAVVTELGNKPNPTPDEERYKVMLQSRALQLNGRNLASIVNLDPSWAGSSQPEQRRPVHQRLRNQGGANQPRAS